MNNIRQLLWLCLVVLCLSVFAQNSFAHTQFHLKSMKWAILDRPDTTLKKHHARENRAELQPIYNLELNVDLPYKLKLKETDLQWRIVQQGVPVQQLLGKQQRLKLPAGSYQVELKIGEWQETQSIHLLKQRRVKPYFRVAVGRVKIKANAQVDWVLHHANNSMHYAYAASQMLNVLLPEGVYQLEASLEAVPRWWRLHVRAGEVTVTEIDMPISEVNLVAIQNNMPLLQTMEWQIYRLEQQERRYLSSYYRHTHYLTIPPGRYEVVAKHQGRQRSRQFQVQENTRNRVILALD